MSGLMQPPPGQEPPDTEPGEALRVLLWMVAWALAWVVGLCLIAKALS